MAAASGSQRTLDGRLLDQAMQEYGLFQVSNARHRADLKLGPLDFVTLCFTRSLVSFPWPSAVTLPLPQRLLVTFTMQVGVARYVYKRISFIKRILPYHLPL